MGGGKLVYSIGSCGPDEVVLPCVWEVLTLAGGAGAASGAAVVVIVGMFDMIGFTFSVRV